MINSTTYLFHVEFIQIYEQIYQIISIAGNFFFTEEKQQESQTDVMSYPHRASLNNKAAINNHPPY